MKIFSEIRSFVYPNGLRLYVLPRPGSASVELHCAVQTGSMHEEENCGCGLSHFLEHMLFQGCQGFPGRSGTEMIENTGGSINAYTSYDRTVYYLQVPEKHSSPALKLLASMVMTPELPEKRFIEEKDVILRECDLYFDSPATNMFLTGFSGLCPRHPMSIPIIGYREMIEKVTRDMAAGYHSRRYTPGRTFFVAVGAVDPDALYEELGELTSSWRRSNLNEPSIPLPAPLPSALKLETSFHDTIAHLGLFLPVIPAEKTLPAEVLFGILAGSSGSRLVRIMEQEKELALELNADMENFSGFNIPYIACAALPGKADRLYTALLKELESIVRQGISKSELQREKTQRYADLLRQMCVPSHIASSIISGVMINSDPAYTLNTMDQLRHLQVEDVDTIAEKYLDSAHILTVFQRPPVNKNIRKAASASAIKPAGTATSAGVRSVSCSDHAVELVSFTMLLPGGAIAEAAHESGISNMIGRCLLNGTSRHNESALASALDRCGMDVSIRPGMNMFMVKMNVPKRHFSSAMKLMSEILVSPAFPELPFERERTALLEKINRRRMKPGKAAWQAGCKALFGSHPYASCGKGDENVLRNLSREDVRNFWQKIMDPERTLIGFAGDISPEEAHRQAEMLSSAISWNSRPALPVQEPVFPSETELIELPIKREQSVVMHLFPAPRLIGRPGDMMNILNHVENGMSSPLFQKVREDNSLAYSVGSRMAGGFHPGVFAFSAATQFSRIEEVEKCFAGEVARLGTEGITEKEFQTARDSLFFRTAQAMESPHAMLDFTLLEMFYGADVNALYAARERLENYTAAECNAMLKEYFSNPVPVKVHAGKLQ